MQELLDIEIKKYNELLQEEQTFRNELLKTRIAREITILKRNITREKERANESDKRKTPSGFIRTLLKNMYRIWNYSDGRIYTIPKISKKAKQA